MENDLNKTQEVSLDEDINELSYIKDSLERMAYWGRFFGVVVYVFFGIGSLGFLYVCINGNITYMIDNAPQVVFGWIIGLVVYYFTAKYWYNFSKEAYVFLKHNLVRSLADGLSNLASLFKLFGVITSIYLGFLFLAFISNYFF